jgi:hypothetical protein
MMKSYQEWVSEPVFSEVVSDVIIESWTGGSSRNWQRIGMLFGLSREPLKFNPLKKDTYKSWGQFATRGSAATSDKGNKVLDTLEKAISGEVPLEELIKMAGNNSPFRLCFNEAQSLQQKLAGKPLDAEETKWLLNTLENFYSNGSVNTGQLKMLWHAITGTPPNESEPKGNPKAVDWDVHSPAHLLSHFKPYGGHGIFSNPSNYQSEIVPLSERIIRTYYPDLANKLLGNYNAPSAAPAAPRPKKGSGDGSGGDGSGGGGGGTPPPEEKKAETPEINTPDDLSSVLGKVLSSGKITDPTITNFINQLITHISKSKAGSGSGGT